MFANWSACTDRPESLSAPGSCMSSRTQNTFRLFGPALVAGLVFITWGAFSLYEFAPEADEGRKQLGQLCGKYRQTADYVRTSINELNDALNGFLQTTNKVQRERFKG